MNKEAETVRIELIFDDMDAAQSFVGYWLDGGGDGGGNLDWDTVYEESDKSNWGKGTRVPRYLRIKGTGQPIENF